MDLQHHGILGMKWGVRRERGPDGLVSKRTVSPDYKRSRQLKKTSLEKMSNEQLRALNERMQLEQSFSRLKKNEISRGKALAQRFMNSSGRLTLAEFIKSRQGSKPFDWKNVIAGIATETLLPQKK